MERVNKKQFAFWEKENGSDHGYWMLFNSLEDAATDSNGRTIYQMDAKPIGKFTIKAVLQKVPQRKKKRK